MTRAQWIKEYHEIHKGHDVPTLVTHPTWLVELAVRYGRLKATGGLRTQTEFKMYDLTSRLDELGVKALTDIWTLMLCNEIADAKEHKRKAPEAPKQAVAKRPTAVAKVLELLRESPVRPDAQVIEAVNAHTFHDGFNRAQLNWYKARFRQGLLKGQNGPESIQEPKTGKPAAQTERLAART